MTPRLRTAMLALAIAVVVAPVARAQAGHAHAAAPAPRGAGDLTVVDLAGTARVLTAAQLAQLPRRTVTATAHGATATYEGPELRAVLAAAGIATDSLRGPALARVVLAVAADQYRIAFAAAELDAATAPRVVVVADRMNGQPLPAADGAWRLVVPDDKRPARWVRQLVRLEVRALAP